MANGPIAVRNLPNIITPQLVTNINLLRYDILQSRAGKVFHADQIPAANTTAQAVDLPSSIALSNALAATYTAHIASACSPTTGQGAHLAADATNVITASTAVDLASTETLLNNLKSVFNSHIAATANHMVADTTNTVATANASNQATANALANALQTAINAHTAAGFNHQALQIVPA